MSSRYIFTSLTRISPLASSSFEVISLPHSKWDTGDYVVCVVNKPYNSALKIELPNGRMAEVAEGDVLVGVLGERFATMEVTGTWRMTGKDGQMQVLTGAGLFGKMTSCSMFLPPLISIRYIGHVHYAQHKATMQDFVPEITIKKFNTPTILMVGTSMSAGKTTVAKIVTRQLKKAGLTVLGAKLTGAGRYRDILSISDAGADCIFDFVDVGLPSTICPKENYMAALQKLLSKMAGQQADVAVVEIGASPLEPYNGEIAIQEIRNCIQCTILCASDPYAVYGVMKAFEISPDMVSGVATNTKAGVALIEKLCGVPALNLIDYDTSETLKKILSNKLNRTL